MSQLLNWETGTALPNIETITGNTGGAVGPNGAGNINLVGANGVTVAGDPGTNTLVVQVEGQFVATVQTVDATPTILYATLVSPSTAIYINAQVIGATAAYNAATGGLLFVAAARAAVGAPVLIGNAVTNTFENAVGADPTFTASIVGNNLEILVTGIAATTINWIGRILVLTQDA